MATRHNRDRGLPGWQVPLHAQDHPVHSPRQQPAAALKTSAFGPATSGSLGFAAEMAAGKQASPAGSERAGRW